MKDLKRKLQEIDGKGYKGYKGIAGSYVFPLFTLFIDYVQGDPFATPSKIRLVIDRKNMSLKEEWFQTSARRIAVEDVLARVIGHSIKTEHFHIKGSGKSGRIGFDTPGAEVLERSAVQMNKDQITVCMSVGLPANGRRINGRQADKLFTQVLPTIMKKSIFAVSQEKMVEAAQLADQQEAIWNHMQQDDLLAFIANGAILPRESGISQSPMKKAIPFISPVENEIEINIPHKNTPLKGMAIKKGITLIVGGGFHGKSTLLEALEMGVYPHVSGDGREYVLTDLKAMKIRAEDGRQITGVDISPFINDLPHKKDTHFFETENASGSTSQAANVMEALEAGAQTLLIDEDTSATNFMIRDQQIRELVKKEKEPITPFISKVKAMYEELDVSTVLVMGGSGDYFSLADDVIMMDEYVPKNVTEKAKLISHKNKTNIDTEKFGVVVDRYFKANSLELRKGKREKVQAKGLYHILMGRTDIIFHQTEQLASASQTRMIADIIKWLYHEKKLGHVSLHELLDIIDDKFDKEGITAFHSSKSKHPGDIVKVRRFEIAAVLNRMRTLKVTQN